MIKQHLYRRSASGLLTAASADIRDGYWSALLAQKAEVLVADPALSYRQYQSERGIVLARSARDQDGVLSHQLLFDEPADIQWLLSSRPLDLNNFITRYAPVEGVAKPLPKLEAASLTSPESLAQSLQALNEFFLDAGQLLARFIAAMRRAAIDSSIYLAAFCDGEPDVFSERVALMMELILRCMPAREARRLGYASYLREPSLDRECPVMFLKRGTALPARLAHWTVTFDFQTKEARYPEGVFIDLARRDIELASAALAHDLNWIDRARNQETPLPEAPCAPKLDMPPFESDMSLRQYVSDWLEELERLRSGIDDAALNRNLVHWSQFESRIISAGEVYPERMAYLKELQAVIGMLYRREHEWLEVPEEVLTNLLVVLLDSIEWVNVDIYAPVDKRFIEKICAYEAVLRRLPDVMDMPDFVRTLDACRMMKNLLEGAPDASSEGLAFLSALHEEGNPLCRDLQNCLNWYADRRVRAERQTLVPDDLLVGAIVMGNAHFSSGSHHHQAIRLDALNRFVGAHCGEAVLKALKKRLRAQMDLFNAPGQRSRWRRMLERAKRPADR